LKMRLCFWKWRQARLSFAFGTFEVWSFLDTHTHNTNTIDDRTTVGLLAPVLPVVISGSSFQCNKHTSTLVTIPDTQEIRSIGNFHFGSCTTTSSRSWSILPKYHWHQTCPSIVAH
jgi:hypothetical protein